MILVDTSVWIEHMRRANEDLSELLSNSRVLAHPFVIGEIAIGGIKPQMLTFLQDLPTAEIAADFEVLGLIRRQSLAGRGIGYIDAHLIASALLTPDAQLWTFDQSLRSVAADLNLALTS